ncbi:MAG: alcohol dehydrogenase catalytic domain-containing protein [Anaerolineae bacterium]|nr:alcohol dehydrogenase catalytic domain-containing protein [Anaerolineae bacterium]
MFEKLVQYQRADAPVPEQNTLWPLYGAGFENLGLDGQPMAVPMPSFGPDELLVRHDACGLCFSDIKVIKAGQSHPRIYRNMQENPVVLGHEVALTVVGVGENLKNQYQVGDRFIVQADIYAKGVNLAYGYETQGGLSQYNVLDWKVLNGDDGNYLIPVKPTTGYAESALTEPWACVIAAYELKYRAALKAGGTTWIVGTEYGIRSKEYTISSGFDATSHPARLLLTNVPAAFAAWLKARAAKLGIEVVDGVSVDAPPVEFVDDIVLLGADPDLIEKFSPRLGQFGIMALMDDQPMPRPVSVDVGRIHYDRWVYVGSKGTDIAQAYSAVPVRAELKPDGKALFVGAGGPMGRMHVQRAIQAEHGPQIVVCTDVSDLRLDDLRVSFAAEAQAKGVEFICLNPMNKEAYAAGMAAFKETGFDDIIVLAPVPAVISEASTWLAPQGVMNIFAGVTKGTMAQIDLSQAYLKDARVIGHSASSIDDMKLMLFQAETGTLSPNRSVAAVGSLSAAKDGLQSVLDTSFPGKVVIYPQIREFPLTSLVDLKEKLPAVHALLKDGREWTTEAEAEFLKQMLP